MYARQKSGVSPEFVTFEGQQDFVNGNGFYILRPETMESLFYMWRVTKDVKWRNYGWAIFRAIERWCTVESGGYSGLTDVNVAKPVKDNLMQSFWMAETLKYAYLLFADDSVLDLSDWVLNTEAHPLRIRRRDPRTIWDAYEAANGVPWLSPTISGVKPIESKAATAQRMSYGSKVTAPPDPSGDEGMDGLPDDDALPFDAVHGMNGLPVAPSEVRSSLMERIFGNVTSEPLM